MFIWNPFFLLHVRRQRIMIYEVVSLSDWLERWYESDRKNQFSQEALEQLYSEYNDYDDWEFDIIEVCCDWIELDASTFKDMSQIIDDYDIDIDIDIYDPGSATDMDELRELIATDLSQDTYAYALSMSILMRNN
jgi:type I site-specific restriction endonuclease